MFVGAVHPALLHCVDYTAGTIMLTSRLPQPGGLYHAFAADLKLHALSKFCIAALSWT